MNYQLEKQGAFSFAEGKRAVVGGVAENPRSCWQTPREILEFISLVLGYEITLDACASRDNAVAGKYYTREMDAFKQKPVDEVIFCNPPYGGKGAAEQGSFLEERCILEWVELGVRWKEEWNTVIFLLPGDFSTEWCELLYENGEINFLRPRVNYLPAELGMKAEGGSEPSLIGILNGRAVGRGVEGYAWYWNWRTALAEERRTVAGQAIKELKCEVV